MTVTFHNTHGGDTSGNWAASIWGSVIVNVPLNAGANTVTQTGSGGFIDLDEITEARYAGAGLPGTTGGSTAAGTVYQAEDASFASPPDRHAQHQPR